MIGLGDILHYVERSTVALERLADAAMIAARAYEETVKCDYGYEPELEDDD